LRVSVQCSGNWMWAAKLEGEGAKLYDAAVAMSDIMCELGIAIDGGKDSLRVPSCQPLQLLLLRMPHGPISLTQQPQLSPLPQHCTHCRYPMPSREALRPRAHRTALCVHGSARVAIRTCEGTRRAGGVGLCDMPRHHQGAHTRPQARRARSAFRPPARREYSSTRRSRRGATRGASIGAISGDWRSGRRGGRHEESAPIGLE
jgi:hypothetical protein